jgi:hypothetical protein
LRRLKRIFDLKDRFCNLRKTTMGSQLPKYAVAIGIKPILNVPHFKGAFGGETGDVVDLAKKIETCALKGTKFRILEKVDETIYRVATDAYRRAELYIDGNFLKLYTEIEPKERERREPPASLILKRLWELEHKKIDYLWGSNCLEGIPEMLTFYPPSKILDEPTKKLWTLTGTDCSGLLYAVTDGFTPRNTSELTTFESALAIEGLSLDAILAQIRPLDLIVWDGHVIIFLNAETTIESRKGKGVIFCEAQMRLKELIEEGRIPLNQWRPSLNPNEAFVIQRWHSEMRFAMSAVHPV